MSIQSIKLSTLLTIVTLLTGSSSARAETQADLSNPSRVTYHTKQISGVDVFYREAGPKDAPTVVLLHGFPTSSHMFRNLIPGLSDRYHVIAPDYPGYGNSAMPSVDDFEYTFDNMTNVVDQCR